MKRLLLFTLSVLAFGQAIAQDINKETLFTVGEDKVTAEEYIAVYNKNRNLGEDIDPKTPKEYLDLYMNFKLKVHEAKQLGMDTAAGFIREYNSYRTQLAKPYLSDRDVTQDLIKEAYNRMKKDVRAAHIMLSAPEEADDIDKMKALGKIKRLRERIMAGEDFDAIAREYSADTYSAKKGGDLGYFTVFGMVYPFESAAYDLKVGEISEPVQSRFGYHLVKKLDERPARGELVVAHILVIDNEKSSPKEKEAAQRKINEIYKQLEGGAEFEELVKRYSEDKSTAPKAGVLQPFGINKMFPEFEEAAFALENVGDYTAPVQTPIGWHIIKLEEKRGIKSFDKAKRELKNRIDKDSRSQQSRQSIVKRLKLEYKFKEYPKAKKAAFAQIDENLLKMAYSSAKAKGTDKLLFQFADKSYTTGEFLTYVDNTQGRSRKTNNLRREIKKAYKSFVEAKLIAYEKTRLEDKYPEFRMLAREYYEGILLFDLTEKKVWKKSVIDTVGLEAFYDTNKNNFMWETRYDVQMVDAASKKLAKKARKMLKKGSSIADVETKLNEDSELNVKIEEGLLEEKENDLLVEYKPEVGVGDIIEKNGRYFVFIVKEKKAPVPKTLDEARGLVISEYQNYLENNWIEELRSKYPVKVNDEVLKKVIEILEVEG